MIINFPAFAATKTWQAAVAGSWSVTENWNGGTPTSNDVAVFDATSGSNCTIDSSISITGINIGSGYTGTISQGTSAIALSSSLAIAGGYFLGGSSSIDINSNFTITGGTFTATSGTMFIAGSGSFGAGTFNHNSGLIQFDGGTATWTPGSGSYQNIVMNKNNVALLTLTGTANIAGNLTLTDGYLYGSTGVAAVSGGSLTIGANLDVGGSGGATILLTGSGNQTISSSQTSDINPLEINKPSGGIANLSTDFVTQHNFTVTAGSFTMNSGTTLTFGGSSANGSTWTSGTGTYQNVTVNKNNENLFTLSGTANIAGNLTLTNGYLGVGVAAVSGGSLTVGSGLDVYSSSATILLNGTSDQTISSSASNMNPLQINKSSGSAILTSNLSITQSGFDLIITSGTFSLAGYSLTVNDNITVGASGTLRLQGAEPISKTSLTLSSGSTVEYTGNGDGSADTYTITALSGSYQNLTLTSTGSADDTFQLGAATDIAGSLIINKGILNTSGSNYNIYLAGNWSNSGTFTANSSTVTFDGSNQTLSGTTTFNNLTKSVATAASFTIAATGSQTVSGTLTLNGEDDQLLTLISDELGSYAYINVSVSTIVSYLNIRDSYNGGIEIDVIDQNCTDLGHNYGWTFTMGSPISFTPPSNEQWQGQFQGTLK